MDYFSVPWFSIFSDRFTVRIVFIPRATTIVKVLAMANDDITRDIPGVKVSKECDVASQPGLGEYETG